MTEIDKELNDPEVVPERENSSADQGNRVLLLKLAERTVLQAEALAQEITEQARKASEAEGVKILERYTAKAEDEARQIVEEAEHSSADILAVATAKAKSIGRTMLGQAEAKQQNIQDSANAEKQSILERAQKERARDNQ